MPWKRPESVLVILHTLDDEVLLLERADHPGWWQSVTGSLEPAECPHQAALREVAEETGLNAAQFELSDDKQINTYEIYPEWRHRYAPGVTTNAYVDQYILGRMVAQHLIADLKGRCPKRLAEGAAIPPPKAFRRLNVTG